MSDLYRFVLSKDTGYYNEKVCRQTLARSWAKTNIPKILKSTFKLNKFLTKERTHKEFEEYAKLYIEIPDPYVMFNEHSELDLTKSALLFMESKCKKICTYLLRRQIYKEGTLYTVYLIYGCSFSNENFGSEFADGYFIFTSEGTDWSALFENLIAGAGQVYVTFDYALRQFYSNDN